MFSVHEGPSPLLTCLVPARNAAVDLPGFLESVSRCCDAVIALDDGSTDDTFQVLEASPLVRLLITNPQRGTYEGWDDAANRSKLLAAASSLQPRWLLWLDADERLDPSDAKALRNFVAEDAKPERAYGFRIFPMRHDQIHFENRFLWVYRLFHHAPGQTLEDRRLHLFPIPSQIPSRRWDRTTIRIQHLGGLTAEHRRQRYEKYRQADPRCEFQSDYSALLREPPADLPRWQPRRAFTPILWSEYTCHETSLIPGSAGKTPAITFLKLLAGNQAGTTVAEADTGAIIEEHAAELRALGAGDFEVLLVENAFSFIHSDLPTLDGLALNAALARARGEVVCLVQPWWHYGPGSFQAMLEAHRRGFAMVAPSPELRKQPVQGSVLGSAPEFCSWSRAVLVEVGGFPAAFSLPCQGFNENLMAAGWQAFGSSSVQVHKADYAGTTPG